MGQVKIECILAQVMREKGVNDIWLRNRTGISVSYITLWKSPLYKHRTPSNYEDMAKIALALDVNVDYIWRLEI